MIVNLMPEITAGLTSSINWNDGCSPVSFEISFEFDGGFGSKLRHFCGFPESLEQFCFDWSNRSFFYRYFYWLVP
jgi:hypothetical protein